MIRIVSCIDIDADTLDEAYRKLCAQMKKLPDGIEWRGSEEWYHDDGTPATEREISTAVAAYYFNAKPNSSEVPE